MVAKRKHEFEPEIGGVDPGEDVRVYVSETRDGHREAVALPASVRRLTGERLELVGELQQLGRQAQWIRLRYDELVPECREAGISWAAIGFSVGLTGEAARQRWGDIDAD